MILLVLCFDQVNRCAKLAHQARVEKAYASEGVAVKSAAVSGGVEDTVRHQLAWNQQLEWCVSAACVMHLHHVCIRCWASRNQFPNFCRVSQHGHSLSRCRVKTIHCGIALRVDASAVPIWAYYCRLTAHCTPSIRTLCSWKVQKREIMKVESIFKMYKSVCSQRHRCEDTKSHALGTPLDPWNGQKTKLHRQLAHGDLMHSQFI